MKLLNYLTILLFAFLFYSCDGDDYEDGDSNKCYSAVSVQLDYPAVGGGTLHIMIADNNGGSWAYDLIVAPGDVQGFAQIALPKNNCYTATWCNTDLYGDFGGPPIGGLFNIANIFIGGENNFTCYQETGSLPKSCDPGPFTEYSFCLGANCGCPAL